MAPVFYRLDADIEEVQGVPTDLNSRLLSGELDLAPISSIEYARHADRLRLLPRLCVGSEGAVDSIQLVSRKPLEQVRSVAVTPESATSVVLTKVLLPEARHVPLGDDAEATLLIGDAALKSAFEDPTPHHDLGRLWLERTGLPMVFAVWACPEPLPAGLTELEDALVTSVRTARAEPETLAHEASARYGYPAGFLARYFEKLRYRFGPREGYLLPNAVIFKKIEETLALGGTGLLMQGGHHPDLAIDYYEDLFRAIKARYPIPLHALSPPEVQHIARRSKLTVPETLSRLRDAGLDSLPGGGGEILVDRVRKIISPKKTTSDEWLNVMRHAHRLGMSTTATMMYGHVETIRERVEHMRRIRDLQDETRGFRAFISWTFPNDGNRLADKVPRDQMPTSFDYLLTQAVSRIYLDNVDHIQSSWVTQGMKIGQVALGFGADDMGSVMIEENVVSAAGTTHRTSTEELVHLIRSIGKTPVQRDTLYRDVKVWN